MKRKRTKPTEKEAERRRKISESMKTYIQNNPKAREIRSESWKGRKHTEESKKKMSLVRMGVSIPHREETKIKISESMKGRKVTWGDKISASSKGKIITQKQRNKISVTLKKYFIENENSFKGKKHTEESKEKMRIANLGKFRGENGPNWRGGISSLPYSIEWTPWLREEIKARDKHKCQNPKCKSPHEKLDIHHIDYNKDNCDPENLILICKICHGKTQRKRELWKRYYQTIQKMRRITTCTE